MKHKIYNKRGLTPTPKLGVSLLQHQRFWCQGLRSKRGFTLVEALVVIFIIGLISAILIVNWRRNEKQYQVQRTAQEIAQNIRRAQDMALNSFRYADKSTQNYGVYLTTSSLTSYIIFGETDNNKRYEAKQNDFIVENINIDSDVVINSLSSGAQPLNLTFSLPDGFTNIYPNANEATITIKRKNGTCPQDCKSIIVRKTGQVNIE